MAITYLPDRILAKSGPKKLLERLVTQDLTVNKTVLNILARSGFLSKGQLEKLALKVIKTYKKKYRDELEHGASKREAIAEAMNRSRLMVNRVQNAVVFEVSKEIKDQYRGEYYKWLPSDAKEPDPLHQLKYGKTFQIGKGEMPGERWGCRCGMYILVDEERLEL